MSGRRTFSLHDGLVGNYVASRSRFGLLMGVPTIAVLVGVLMVHGWLGDVEVKAVPAYARMYDGAVEAGDTKKQQVALNALVRMRPDNREYRYNLALLKLSEPDRTSGIAMMRSLADRGFHRASLWAAKYELSQRPLRTDAVRNVVTSLREVVKDESENAVAHALLADAYLLLRQPKLAAPHTRAAASLDPVYWLKYATLLSRLGQPQQASFAAEQATKALEELVSRDPADVQRRIQWSHALRAQGELEAALSALEQGLAIASDSTPLKKELCVTIVAEAMAERAGGIVNYRRFSRLIQKGLEFDHENLIAIRELSKIPVSSHQINQQLLERINGTLQQRLEEEPDDLDVVGLLAWSEFHLGRQSEGLDRLQKLVAQHPQKRLQLAGLLRESGQTAAAMQEANTGAKYFHQQLQLDPSPAHRLGLAEALAFLNRWDSAINVLDAAEETSDAKVKAAQIRFRLRLFQELSSTGENQAKQLSLLDSALAIDPENHLAVAGLGMLAGGEGSVATAARRLLVQMLAEGRNTRLVHSHLGGNAIDDGNYDEAIKHLEQAIRQARQDPLICNNLAFAICAQSKNGDRELDRALRLANTALTRLPKNPVVLRTRGAVFLKLNRPEDALHDFERILATGEANPELHRYLAEAYTGLGNEELATVHQRLADRPSGVNENRAVERKR